MAWLDSIKFGLSEVKELFNKAEKRKQKSYLAIETVYKAANETSTFLAKCKRKTEAPNTELSNIWIEAASKVRELDSELYTRLLAKSEYWANPEEWTKDKIEEYNISLESIKNDCKAIIDSEST